MNLYLHFPFCRRKCAYCALFSVAGRDEEFRDGYARSLAKAVASERAKFKSVYFGGGTPALCNLSPVFEAVQGKLKDGYEWTVEINPLDVTYERMKEFRAAGVNRISMGVQSLDDATLLEMGRGHTADDALNAFRIVRDAGFDNAGIDLISGYPSPGKDAWKRTLDRLQDFSPDHCSVYSLIREKGTLVDLRIGKGELSLPGDDTALEETVLAGRALEALSCGRYEISSYAKKGRECLHNLSVWRGEDYLGFGAGAHGRIGRYRSEGTFGNPVPLTTEGVSHPECCTETGEEEDALERVLFRLRTCEGLDLKAIGAQYPVLLPRLGEWRRRLSALAQKGIVADSGNGNVFVLAPRGMEVCDAVLSELV